MNASVNFKFCGGCNPKYDRKQVHDSVEERLEEMVVHSTCQKCKVLSVKNKASLGKKGHT